MNRVVEAKRHRMQILLCKIGRLQTLEFFLVWEGGGVERKRINSAIFFFFCNLKYVNLLS